MKLELKASIASDDATETYEFVLEAGATQAKLGWTLNGAGDAGELTFPTKLLGAATRSFWIDQGAVMSIEDGEVKTHRGSGKLGALPAFLIPRTSYQKLAKGAAIEVPGLWTDAEQLAVKGTRTVTLEVAGKSRKVPVMIVEGDGIRLEILRAPEWPIVLERQEGDNHLSIGALSALPAVETTPIRAAKAPPAASATGGTVISRFIDQLSDPAARASRELVKKMEQDPSDRRRVRSAQAHRAAGQCREGSARGGEEGLAPELPDRSARISTDAAREEAALQDCRRGGAARRELRRGQAPRIDARWRATRRSSVRADRGRSPRWRRRGGLHERRHRGRVPRPEVLLRAPLAVRSAEAGRKAERARASTSDSCRRSGPRIVTSAGSRS